MPKSKMITVIVGSDWTNIQGGNKLTCYAPHGIMKMTYASRDRFIRSKIGVHAFGWTVRLATKEEIAGIKRLKECLECKIRACERVISTRPEKRTPAIEHEIECEQIVIALLKNLIKEHCEEV